MKKIFSFLLVLVLVACLLPTAALAADKVVLSPQNLIVDGKTIECEKYNINGSNYFKLRDIALLVNGTGSQFSVGYDAVKKTVSIVTGEAYTSNGSELDLSGGDKSATAKPSTQTILINGEERSDLSVYNIGGNNFFKLRDLGTALGFDVDYDSKTNSAIVISRSSEPSGWDGAYIGGDAYKVYIAQDLDDLWDSLKGELGGNASAESAYKSGAAAIRAAGTVAEVRSAYRDAVAAIRNAIPLADGFFSFESSSEAERTKLLGILERYAVDTGIAGITIYNNSSLKITSKLNVNGLDAKTWEALFGTGGSVIQTAKSNYWTVKPWLANRHFVRALSYSIDRVSLVSDKAGYTPSVDYLSDSYLMNGVSYNGTKAHQQAVAPLLRDTDGKGYSLKLARDYFRMALTELEAEGAITPGTKDNPAVLNIEIGWESSGQKGDHEKIKSFFETAFNDDSVCGGVYKLNISYWCGSDGNDVYYDKLMVGQYDMAFGSVSGNYYDPIDLLTVLSSDPVISLELTLSWAVDTGDPAAWPLVYNGKAWSYDALCNAANTYALASKGKDQPVLSINYKDIRKNDDGSYTGSFTVTKLLPSITEFTPTSVVCCNYERYFYGDGEYDEIEVDFTVEESKSSTYVITFTVPAEVAEDYYTGSGTSEDAAGYTGFDLYYDLTVNGSAISFWESVYDYFESPD